MTADQHSHIPAPSPAYNDAAIVVELGRSTGSGPVAAGLALAQARTLDRSGWVLLAELNPRGGDLLEKHFLGTSARSDTERDVPAGVRELAERLASVDLDPTVSRSETAAPSLRPYLIGLSGVPNLRLLVGDPMVEGAARAASIIGPRLAGLARSAGAHATIVDAGPWTSSEPQRLAGAGLIYAVVEANSASQNSRCRAELSALWRLLQAAGSSARLIAVIVNPGWPVADLRELFAPPEVTADARGFGTYRAAILTGRRNRRTLSLLASGDWRSISDRALDPFFELASPLTDPVGARPAPMSVAPTQSAPPLVEPDLATPPASPPAVDIGVDEHAYLARAVTGPSVGDQPGLSPTTGWSPAVAEPAPDPDLWPFAALDPMRPSPAQSPAIRAALVARLADSEAGQPATEVRQ